MGPDIRPVAGHARMLTLYVTGNLLGRLLASYLIVWLVCVAMGRDGWRAAVRRTGRWYSIVAVLVLFLAGLSGTLGPSAGA